jgi:hypothetical protein
MNDSRREGGVRVIVAIAPRSYREALALYVRQQRPQAEVLIVAPEALAAETQRLEPHLVVSNEVPEGLRGSALSWIEVLFEDSLDARVSVDNRSMRKIEDIGMDDLLEILDETEELRGKERDA